jgi:hypothetical protein
MSEERDNNKHDFGINKQLETNRGFYGTKVLVLFFSGVIEDFFCRYFSPLSLPIDFDN